MWNPLEILAHFHTFHPWVIGHYSVVVVVVVVDVEEWLQETFLALEIPSVVPLVALLLLLVHLVLVASDGLPVVLIAY